jgi:hypothetical protein
MVCLVQLDTPNLRSPPSELRIRQSIFSQRDYLEQEVTEETEETEEKFSAQALLPPLPPVPSFFGAARPRYILCGF